MMAPQPIAAGPSHFSDQNSIHFPARSRNGFATPGSWARIEARMAEVHLEPYLVLAGLTHNAALIAWGGFYFRVRGRAGNEQWKLVDDSDLDHLHPPRYECIGV